MRQLRLILSMLAFAFSFNLSADYPIIYMVATPRSLSTAFTRMMYERGDFAIFHEPSVSPFAMLIRPTFVEENFTSQCYLTFEAVKESLFAEASVQPVFVKDVSFSIEDFLCQDERFVANDQLRFCFLLRNPHHAAISFFLKNPAQVDRLSRLMGYEQMYHILECVERITHKKPYLIMAEDLYHDPEKIVSEYCAWAEIPFMPESLSWEPLGNAFDLQEEWHEYKFEAMAQVWQGDAFRSSGFGKPGSYAVDEMGNPTFEEVTDPGHRDILRGAYEHNLHFYRLILERWPN